MPSAPTHGPDVLGDQLADCIGVEAEEPVTDLGGMAGEPERYELGKHGALNARLSAGQDPLALLDQLMDFSDPELVGAVMVVCASSSSASAIGRASFQMPSEPLQSKGSRSRRTSSSLKL